MLVPGRASGRHASRPYLRVQPPWLPSPVCSARHHLAVALANADPATGSVPRRGTVCRPVDDLPRRRHDPTRPSPGGPAERDPSFGEGLGVPQNAADHRPQGHRDPVPDHVVRVLPGRWRDGALDPGRAGRAGSAVPVHRAVQPAVHHARHGHAAAVRDPDPVRVRELHRAAADRSARRRVPAAERLLVLAVPVRQPDRPVRVPHTWRAGVIRLDRLRATTFGAVFPRSW